MSEYKIYGDFRPVAIVSSSGDNITVALVAYANSTRPLEITSYGMGKGNATKHVVTRSMSADSARQLAAALDRLTGG